MKGGTIQQIGTPQEVFDHPANLFVAGFIGSPQMNFFDGKLVRANGVWQVETAGAVIPLGKKTQGPSRLAGSLLLCWCRKRTAHSRFSFRARRAIMFQ